MKSFSFFLILSILMVSQGLTQPESGHGKAVINHDLRNAWLSNTVERLRSFQPGPETKEIAWKSSYRNDGYVTACRIIESGLLRIGTSEWVYVESTSSHEQPEVGDITLAIDSKGRLFQHKGHICGGIINFRSTDQEMPASSDDFFRKFSDDVLEAPWEPLSGH